MAQSDNSGSVTVSPVVGCMMKKRLRQNYQKDYSA